MIIPKNFVEIANTPPIKTKMNKQSGLRISAEIFSENFVEIANTPMIKAKMSMQSKRKSAISVFIKNFVEIANTLQRFRFLRSVVYRSGFGGLQSKFGCGILRQRSSRSSGNQDFYRSPSEGLPPEEGKRNTKRSFRTHCARQRKVRRAAERSAYETLNT